MSRFTKEEQNAVLDMIADALSSHEHSINYKGDLRALYSNKYYGLFHAAPKLLDWCKRAWIANSDHARLTWEELVVGQFERSEV